MVLFKQEAVREHEVASLAVTGQSTKAPRNLQLDVLRGFAILMVLLCHTYYLRPATWDAPFWRPSWSGVDLFFVISGFLISGLLFSEYRKTGRIQFGRFAIRRALKIYPAFYAILILTAAYRIFKSHGAVSQELRSQLLHDVFFVQSYRPGTYGHFWSLSVEEHFYILLPVTLWLLMRVKMESGNPFRSLPSLFAVVATVLLVTRLLTARFVPFTVQTHLMPTHLRLDSLFCGVIVSFYYNFHRERFSEFARKYRTLILCVAALLLSPMIFIGQYDQWMYTYGFTVVYLGYACLLVGFLYLPMASFNAPVRLAFRFIAYIGTFSYSIYLWHLVVLGFVEGIHAKGVVMVARNYLIFFAGSILLGIGASKLIEIPSLRIRDRFFP